MFSFSFLLTWKLKLTNNRKLNFSPFFSASFQISLPKVEMRLYLFFILLQWFIYNSQDKKTHRRRPSFKEDKINALISCLSSLAFIHLDLVSWFCCQLRKMSNLFKNFYDKRLLYPILLVEWEWICDSVDLSICKVVFSSRWRAEGRKAKKMETIMNSNSCLAPLLLPSDFKAGCDSQLINLKIHSLSERIFPQF